MTLQFSISQWSNQWGMTNFDSPQFQNRFIDFDEIRTLGLSPEEHTQCKISFRSDDVGGLSYTQFATVTEKNSGYIFPQVVQRH